MVENYLNNSKQLRQIFLLIDIRHEPSANDKMMYDWICYQGLKPIIIATKADKIKKSQLEKHLNMIRENLNMPEDGIIMPYSALSKFGRDEIYELLEKELASAQE